MLLDRLLGRPEKLATATFGYRLSEVPGQLYSQPKSKSGAAVGPEEALSLSAVWAGVSLLSSIIGALPLSVYRKNGQTRNVADDHPAQRMLHTELNPDMTASIGRRTMEFNRLMFGYEAAEIGWGGGGLPRWLWPLEAWRVKPKRDPDGKLYYEVDGTRRVEAKDMIYVPLVSFDGTQGVGFVDYAIESLGLGISAQEFAATFFGNGARPGGLLKIPGNPDIKTRTTYREEWDKFHGGGAGNSHRTGILWGGMEYVPNSGSIDPDKAQLLEQRRFNTEEVARWLNIPPHLLRDLSRATFSNIEEQGIDFVTYTLNQPLVNKEQEFDRKLLDPPGLYCKHNLYALLKGNSQAQANFLKTLWLMGVVSQNEIRELLEFNPVANGDVYYVPVNMTTVEKAIAATPEPFAPSAPKAPDVFGEATPGDETDDDKMSEMGPVVVDTLQRLGRKEANEARRAAKSPDKFFDWMDNFYPRFELTLAQALRPAVPAQAATLASRWCEVSKAKLLDVTAAAKPQELYGLIDETLKLWERERPEAAAELLIGDEHATI